MARAPRMPSRSQLQSQLRAATRKAQQDFEREFKREVGKVARQVDAEQRRQERTLNAAVDRHNRQARQRPRSITVTQQPMFHTTIERRVIERVPHAIAEQDALREVAARDVFISYAMADGQDIAEELRIALDERGVDAWLASEHMVPGRSQALQINDALTTSRAGVVIVTPLFLAGTHWTKRELGALLHKDTVIPIVHRVTFAELSAQNLLLADMHGFSTQDNTIDLIADKIAYALTLVR